MKACYEIIRKRGEGGYGVVYLAYDHSTQRHVAIKYLKDTSPEGKERFRRELLMLYRQLDNPFIVGLLDHDLDNEPPYIVLEYCEHGSLRAWVEQGCPWRDVAFALAQVIQGLEKIHEIGGFHRDIKPDNLLLASGPTPGTIVVKIADFGLARVPDSQFTMTRNCGGTAGYIAPEVAGGADFHPSADIYSLGIVATELLTGSRDPARLHDAKAPSKLRDLVLAMCSVVSTDRPTARDVAVVLNDLLNPPKAPKAPPSSRRTVLGGARLFLATLAGLAALAAGDEAWDVTVRRSPGRRS